MAVSSVPGDIDDYAYELGILNAIDRRRYNTYRARYYGVIDPPVMFRPIFFWHRPPGEGAAVSTGLPGRRLRRL